MSGTRAKLEIKDISLAFGGVQAVAQVSFEEEVAGLSPENLWQALLLEKA